MDRHLDSRGFIRYFSCCYDQTPDKKEWKEGVVLTDSLKEVRPLVTWKTRQEREAAGHTAVCQEAEQTGNHVSSSKTFSLKSYTALPNGGTNWGPSVQTLVNLRELFHIPVLNSNVADG